MLVGINLPELAFILLFNVIPLVVVLYLLRLLVRFLKLSISEMEGRERVRAEREPEVAEVRHALSVTLRERREACGMTQELVAQRLGVSRQAVSKWENGVSDPSTANLVALGKHPLESGPWALTTKDASLLAGFRQRAPLIWACRHQ